MIRAFYPKEGKLLHLDCESLVSIIFSNAEVLQFSLYPKVVAIRETGEERKTIRSTSEIIKIQLDPFASAS